MANAEHLTLSEYIKAVHRNLRRDTQLLGESNAWKKHCEQQEQLQSYADAMRKLATEHWDLNMAKDLKATSRITWVYDQCKTYFTEGQIQQCRQKELEIALKNDIPLNISDVKHVDSKAKLKLLDVGSCYNPFGAYQCFDVFPIDLAPATNTVYKCDFLNVPLTNMHCKIEGNDVRNLEVAYFDVVVFSLFLEYLPSSEQRLLSCNKANSLLKPEGLLLIITPDSKHIGANAKYMKSWRHALAKIGLSRVKYVKLPHIHCMAFRKCLDCRISQRWAQLHEKDAMFDGIFIPQDFNMHSDECSLIVKNASVSEDCTVYLESLPFFTDEDFS